MAESTSAEIAARIANELASTALGCSALIPLFGGTANFIFKGQLLKPLDDGTTEVVIKHGERYSASSSSLKLSTARCTLEHDCLKAVEKRLPPTSSEACSIRTPKVYLYNSKSSTLVQEYLPHALDLKTYALKHFSATTPASTKPQIIEIGKGLGKWLRSFHAWAATQESLRNLARTNRQMQCIKLKYNYGLLLQRVDSFPTILTKSRSVFEEVFAMAQAELGDEDKLQVIHGDFWTGNLKLISARSHLLYKKCGMDGTRVPIHCIILISFCAKELQTDFNSILIPNEDIESGSQTSLFVIDWEMCQLWKPQLDLGQMIAELYELTLYKDIQAGLWLIEGFVSGYGFVDDSFAFRTLLHVGTHLVGFGSMVAGWGTTEQRESVARTGRDIILRAWQKDKSWFAEHDLMSLFK